MKLIVKIKGEQLNAKNFFLDVIHSKNRFAQPQETLQQIAIGIRLGIPMKVELMNYQ